VGAACDKSKPAANDNKAKPAEAAKDDKAKPAAEDDPVKPAPKDDQAKPPAVAKDDEAKLANVAKPVKPAQPKGPPGLAVTHKAPATDALKPLAKMVADAKLFENVADALNKSLKFTGAIPISVQECGGKEDLAYDKATGTVRVCYELIASLGTLFSKDRLGKAVERATAGSTLFLFLRAVGHAVIDHFKLAVTGNVEDAADQAAVYTLVQAGSEGAEMALHGAELFHKLGKQEAKEGTPKFWQRLSLSEQRLYNVMCWVLGSDPSEHLVLWALMPTHRSFRCRLEYTRLAKAWDKLLAPHSKLADKRQKEAQEPIAADAGLKAEYVAPTKNLGLKPIHDLLSTSKSFDTLFEGLNRHVKWRVKLPVRFTECGVVNAFYNRLKKRIDMCYELVEAFSTMMAQEYKGKALEDAIVGSIVFVFFHELGHAATDLFQLPLTGREEDAVDQLAGYMLLANHSGDANTAAWDLGERYTIAAAVAFNKLGGGDKPPPPEKLPYWGEHAFGQQRFYSILCWVYGKDPKRYANMVADGRLPKERANSCVDEYKQMTMAWGKVIAPHINQ